MKNHITGGHDGIEGTRTKTKGGNKVVSGTVKDKTINGSRKSVDDVDTRTG